MRKRYYQIIAFIGFEGFKTTSKSITRLNAICEYLINEHNAHAFIFSLSNRFNDASYDIISELKGKYPYITRAIVKTDNIEENKNYLKDCEFEEIIDDNMIINSQNTLEKIYTMIDISDACIFYRNKNSQLSTQSYDYARNLHKKIYDVI